MQCLADTWMQACKSALHTRTLKLGSKPSHAELPDTAKVPRTGSPAPVSPDTGRTPPARACQVIQWTCTTLAAHARNSIQMATLST
jgi:hypothetical protein